MTLLQRLTAVIQAIGADIKAASKRNPLTRTQTAAATLTPNVDAYDVEVNQGLTGALTIANPTGTPGNQRRLIIELKDNGTARAISWGNIYRSATGAALPNTTTAGKRHRLFLMYSSADTKWDLVATSTET